MNAPRWEPDPDEIAALVEASCRAQGLPVKVDDPTVLEEVALLLNRSDGQIDVVSDAIPE